MAQTALTRLPASQQLQRLSALLRPLLPLSIGTMHTVLSWAPVLAKYLLYLLFLINLKSWPLVWHFRVFRPVFQIRISYRLLRLRIFLKSKKEQELEEDKWLESISPIGENPLAMSTTFYTRVTIDDSDFNGHLSNSSYAKTLDSARFKAGLAMFPQFFRAGGWMALAGTHYSFLREIPMFAQYEVRVSVGGWDQKWIYIVSRFVTKKKRRSKETTKTTPNGLIATAPATDANSVSLTPAMAPTPSGIEQDNTAKTLDAVVAELLAEVKEEDDEILNTVAVSQVCCKIGRITVPPAIALACNGFSVPAKSGPVYSRQNAPPSWGVAKTILSKPHGGSMRKLHNFMKSGWKEVPEGQRWWEDALGGVIEERRQRNLVILDTLRKGMTGAKGV
ncbi:hypothetical protein AX16_006336 [Volvariella volvacea WC 439]|nr:hypothetical protein AX16_006336 [Volvariella volvacea WC 439]